MLSKQSHSEPWVKHVYVPLTRSYKRNQGLSEKLLRERLEKNGWMVWRGGSINMLSYVDLFPNVRKKYETLIQLLRNHDYYKCEELKLLSAVHHGMPDFICYRFGIFKFVECKLAYEQLSKRQIICIQRLLSLGFNVEVHKLVHAPTKTRIAQIHLLTKEKQTIEYQKKLTRK